MMSRKHLWLAPLFVCAMALTACGADGPGDVAVKFNRALADGDGKRAAAHLDPEAPQMIRGMVEDKAEEMAKEMREEKDGLRRVRAIEQNIDGDNATVKIEATFGDGTTEEDEVEMVRRDGRWYVKVDMEGGGADKPEGAGDMPDLQFDFDAD